MIRITKDEFSRLAQYIKTNYGIHLKNEKKILLEGRLQFLLEEMGYSNFSDYYNYVVSDKTGYAGTILADKISTNHTYFMRESEHFYYFRDHVMPYLKKSEYQNDLRIWCAACSSGEEPYTLAMILDEYFGNEKLFWDTKILATDLSNAILEFAIKGTYSADRISPLPPIWKSKYFIPNPDGTFSIHKNIKNEIIFRMFNLMEKNLPFKKKFHVIFCRNVMIYFDNTTRNDLVNRFYDALEDGGYLFIGHSETIDRTRSKFHYIIPSVYRK